MSNSELMSNELLRKATVVVFLTQDEQSEFLHEFPFLHYGCFQNMSKKHEDKWLIDDFENLVPLMFSIKAKKV